MLGTSHEELVSAGCAPNGNIPRNSLCERPRLVFTADLLVLPADPSADIAHLRRLTHVMRGGVLRTVEGLASSLK
jgi:hypothetical protein